MANFQVAPPETFTFSKPEHWEKWKQRFERFRIASGLNSKTEKEQVNCLIYSMGDKAEDIFTSFGLDEAERDKFDTVIARFSSYFIVKKNTIFERAQFNRRIQHDGESANDFITALYSLSEHCEYGILTEELIRDRIVVGIRDKSLSEKLQLDSELTLEKCIEKVRLSEAVKQQQTLICDKPPYSNVNRVKFQGSKPAADAHYRKESAPRIQNATKQNKNPAESKSTCKYCAKGLHSRKFCPAKDKTCKICSKVGHFAKVCFQGKKSISFLGSVMFAKAEDKNDDFWSANIVIENKTFNFKIDSGADNTVIPLSVFKSKLNKMKMYKSDKKLCGPDRKELKVMGKLITEIKLDNKSCIEEIYVIDGLQTCLLGKPAIKAFGLIPKFGNSVSEIVDAKKEFPELFRGLGLVEGHYSIKLKQDAVPYAVTAPRRIPIPLMRETKVEIESMVKQGVIIPVTESTEWCSPIVVVPKNSGKVRICVDLTKLNKSVEREYHPIPSVDYTLNLLKDAKIFSKLDANSGFWQVPLDTKSSFLTTFITPFGRFRFLRLPFGISSAPEHFQRRINQILEGETGTVCHMDDILVWGSNPAEHDFRLRSVLQKLREAGITLNEDKCSFAVKKIKFLGHVLDETGIHPDSEKIAAIVNFEPPKNKTELKRLLGMTNYLAKFVPNYAEMLNPLITMLSNKNKFVWDIPQKEAFDNLKKILISNPVLKVFDPEKHSTITCDASSYGIGAILRQEQENGKFAVIAYASRTLTPIEQKYAQIEKEALAIAWSCEKFRDYITGTHFKIETDHRPLIPIFSNKNLDDLSPRLQRLRLRMMRYSYSISHVPGKELYAADALSRTPLKVLDKDELEEEIQAYIHMVVSALPASRNRLEDLKKAQLLDDTCQKLRDYAQNGWPMSKKTVDQSCLPFWQHRYEISIQDGLLMRGSRIIIPRLKRKEVLDQIHEGHLGITKCRARARSAVYWPKINTEIEETVKNCFKCIQETSCRAEPLISTEFPSRPWEIVGMDLFKLNGFWYLIVMDYYSRYPEIAKLTRLTSEEVITHCCSMFARHGIPDIVRSDNGPQFGILASSDFFQFAKKYGFQHITSSPRYPQSNGFIESAVKTVKSRIKKSTDPYLALMAYRATPLENGLSPAELLMNRRIKTTLPIANSQLKSYIPATKDIQSKEDRRISRQTENFNASHGARDLPELRPGEGVWITDRKATGTVEKKLDAPRSYLVRSNKNVYRRNRKHLVPAPDVQPETDGPDDDQTRPISPEREVEVHSEVSNQDSRNNCNAKPSTYVSRSGRVVRPPTRLDL